MEIIHKNRRDYTPSFQQILDMCEHARSDEVYGELVAGNMVSLRLSEVFCFLLLTCEFPRLSFTATNYIIISPKTSSRARRTDQHGNKLRQSDSLTFAVCKLRLGIYFALNSLPAPSKEDLEYARERGLRISVPNRDSISRLQTSPEVARVFFTALDQTDTNQV